MKQGYDINYLKRSFIKFFSNYEESMAKYQVTVAEHLHDVLEKSEINGSHCAGSLVVDRIWMLM